MMQPWHPWLTFSAIQQYKACICSIARCRTSVLAVERFTLSQPIHVLQELVEFHLQLPLPEGCERYIQVI
jgi:hypothetical protein